MRIGRGAGIVTGEVLDERDQITEREREREREEEGTTLLIEAA